MKLIYDNKSINLKKCNTFFSRFKGFMLQKNINYSLLFEHCNSIHTFFMYENIDVIMCDKNNIILFYYPNIKRNRIILPKKGVSKVFETPPNYFNIKINSKIYIKE